MAKKAQNKSTGYQTQDSRYTSNQQQRQNDTQQQRQQQQQTSSFDPYAAAGDNARLGLTTAMARFRDGGLTPQAFGSMVGDQSLNTLQAQEGLARTARDNQITGQAQDAWSGMLNADPYAGIDAVQENALRAAMPSAASYFGNSGMLNSSVAGEGMGEAAARAVAPIHFDAYNQDQNRRLQAMSMAPQMQQMSYADDMMLGQVGQMQDARTQALLDDEARQYYESGNRNYENLQRLMGLSLPAAGIGGTSTSSGMSMGNQYGSSYGTNTGSGTQHMTGSSMDVSKQSPGVMSTLGGLLSAGSTLGGLF